jgi:8-oxo-dGTP pyrophosphatase MutT (NUDIX family)
VNDDLTIPPWQTTDSRLVYTHPQLCLFEYQVIRANGTPAVRHRLTESASVRVVAVDPDGSLALIWHWRYALGYPCMELPSATVEPDEEPLQAAQRALREGCGLTAGLWVRVGQLTAATDIAAQTIHLYRAERLHRVPQPVRDDERLGFALPYGAAIATAVTGAIDDAVSAAALLHAEHDRLQGAWELPDAKPPGPPKLFRV